MNGAIEKLKTLWPVILAAGTILIGLGRLEARVTTTEQRNAELRQEYRELRQKLEEVHDDVRSLLRQRNDSRVTER